MFKSKNNDIIDGIWYEKDGSTYRYGKASKTKSVFKTVLNYVLIACISVAGGYVGSMLHQPKTVKSVIPSYEINTVRNNDQLTMQEVIQKTHNSVVEITTETVARGFFSQQMIMTGAGSGVIFTSDGYIVTNNHVIEDTKVIRVRLANGQEYEAKLIGVDVKSDIAVIKIDAKNLEAAILGNSEHIQVGDTAIAIGNPLGELGGTVTSGIISALDREITIGNQVMNLLQTNAQINRGNSGGGLFNSKGELIGIVNAKSAGTSIEGIGFAIPINDVNNVVEQIINNGFVTNRATLGVTVAEIKEQDGKYPAGLYISSVIKGSAADKAGLKEYDQILFAGDERIQTYNDLAKVLKKKNVGDSIMITVVRDNQKMEVDVILQESGK